MTDPVSLYLSLYFLFLSFLSFPRHSLDPFDAVRESLFDSTTGADII
jgi:hypothetical protein